MVQPLATLAVRGLSVLASFVITWFLGRTLGPEANGQYALVTQTAMFLAVVAVGGLDLAIVRTMSRSVAAGVALSPVAVARVGGYALVAFAIPLIVLLVGGTRLLEYAGVPAFALWMLVALLASRIWTRVLSATLRSQGWYVVGQTVEVLAIPLIVCTALAADLAGDVASILWWTAVAGLATGLIATGFTLSLTRRGADAMDVSMSEIRRVAAPLWGVAVAMSIADWYSLATAARMLSVYDAGLFRVAWQLGSVFTIISSGLFGVYSVRISTVYAKGDLAGVGRICRSATRLSVACVLPAALILIVFAEQVLGFIGPQFVSAAPIVRVIALGQAIYTVIGPAGIALAMTGHERMNLRINLTSVVALLILAPLAALWGGLFGIATIIALLLVARNAASVWAMHRYVGLNVVTGRVVGPGVRASNSEKT